MASKPQDERLPPWQRKLLIGGVLLAGVVAFVFIARQLLPTRSQALPPEEIHKVFQQSEEIDRKNWEKMWRDAGKTPPKS